jgi:LPS export ABC transporter protein LptC
MRVIHWITLVAVLTGCNENQRQPPIAKRSALADSADQIMFGTKFTLTDNGVARALLFADTAFFFEDNTRVELQHVRMTFYTTTGEKNAVLTSRRGTYRTQTGQMIARGNVVVISEDGRELRSEELKYDQGHNEVASDSAFVLTEPERRMEGIGFRSDPNLKNVHVLKVLSGTSGPVTIPKQ